MYNHLFENWEVLQDPNAHFKLKYIQAIMFSV